jgi:hypothetical protein
MRGRLFLMTAVAGFSLMSGRAAASVAFIGLEGLGLDRATVQPIERLLERVLADQIGTNLVRPDQIAAALMRPGLESLRDCTGDMACLVDLGGVLEVDRVIYGTLTRLGENFVVVLKAIDVATGEEESRVREELSGAEEKLLDAVRDAARQLLDVHAYLHEVIFTDLPADARVEIDGQSITAIAGDSVRVTAGRHAVTVAVPDLGSRSFWIEVVADGVTRVDAGRARLAALGGAEQPTGVQARREATDWWSVGAAGAGGALLIAGGTLGILANVEKNAFIDNYRSHALDAEALRDQYDAGRAYARWANVTLGAGATLAGVGLAAWLLRGDPTRPPSLVEELWRRYGQTVELGVGGTALATGTVLGVLSWRQERAFIDAFRFQPGELTALNDLRAQGETYALWANVLLAAGTVLMTAGALDWWLLAPAAEASPTSP